ncbi:10066_t:CDS:1 [Ambispora leptoticha]|uniref:10066_t:CDS:1 n=1 Tax=Ambispora leptoticha TaxID=144679 RepID=A0A9N9A2I3_9GLOM|nr:10066_t:CDS:1 [Ambispora leptoticha]
MAYVNTLPIRIHNSSKIPIAVDNEGFFYRHHPVTFSLVSVTRNKEKSYSATGRVFITDKRLIFVADKPSEDGFETFSLILKDVSTSTLASVNPIASRYTFAVTLSLNSSSNNNAIDTLKVTVTFDPTDVKAKKTMADYYSMIMQSSLAANQKKSEVATLESVTALNADGIGDPPSYRRETHANEISFGYNRDNNHHSSVGAAVSRDDDSSRPPPPPYSSLV